jgi:endonuclease III
LYSFAKEKDDCHFEEEIKQHRQNSRELLLKQLVKWKYDREAMSDQTRKDYHLERCFAFHVFTIMSGSQGTKDKDGIDRLNQLISGDRTGPFSICRALQHSPFEKCVDFFVKLLNSGKNQGLQKSRVTIFLELAIYFETVWLKETPTNFYDLCRIYGFAQKKARVSVNAIGVSDGVGIDEHVKRFLKDVLGLNYNINDLYALLSNLPPRICLNVNDNIGEIGMKLNNIKRKEVKNEEEKRKQEADRIWITHL